MLTTKVALKFLWVRRESFTPLNLFHRNPNNGGTLSARLKHFREMVQRLGVQELSHHIRFPSTNLTRTAAHYPARSQGPGTSGGPMDDTRFDGLIFWLAGTLVLFISLASYFACVLWGGDERGLNLQLEESSWK
jgi:hypothetical protein